MRTVSVNFGGTPHDREIVRGLVDSLNEAARDGSRVTVVS